MKKLLLMTLTMGLIAFIITGFTTNQNGSIKASLTPAEAVNSVLVQPEGGAPIPVELQNGAFEISLPAGSYKVTVDAALPYVDWVKEGVEVDAGQQVNLGTIELLKLE